MASQTSGAVDDRFRSLFVDRRRPLKAQPPDSATVQAQHSALRTVNHLQVLVYRAPGAVPVLEHAAAHLRGPRSSSLYLAMPPVEDPMTRAEEDAREAARRLIDWVQVYAPKRPHLVTALDHVTRALVVEEGRHLVTEQLQKMTPENIATMVAVAAQLMKNQDTTPDPPA